MHVWIKVAIFDKKHFVIQITIGTFVHSEKLVVLALRILNTSDPEEGLKVKS
jgi:hypothetical protein